MASDKSVEKIKKARNTLSKGEALRDEALLVVSPHINWEVFLTPAPMCVCLLGELMAVATTADFTLENNPPKDGFKLMRWPSSFRASLMQVSIHIKFPERGQGDLTFEQILYVFIELCFFTF